MDEIEAKKGTTSKHCGNQVEDWQIDTCQKQIFSELECEYNSDMLKHSKIKNYSLTSEQVQHTYEVGLNTLKALMYVCRLQKEWATVTSNQYPTDTNKVDSDQCVTLLVRCKKMYEAKAWVERLLQLSMDKDSLVSKVSESENPTEHKELLTKIKRFSSRITHQINTLQEEHRIFKRPFVYKGQDYLCAIKEETEMLESSFRQKYFVDETGTAGEAYTT